MKKRITIALVNHSFQVGYFSRRWELFAQQHPDVEIYLLAPEKREWYGGKAYQYDKSVNKIVESQNFDKGNYHRRVFRVKCSRYSGWTSPDFRIILEDIKADVVYHIGTHNMNSLKQLLQLRTKYFPSMKVIAFSMRGPALNLKKNFSSCSLVKKLGRFFIYHQSKSRLDYINRNVDAFFCHYPEAISCFRKEGYDGPIYMQTQVGVNEEWFHEDFQARKNIREKYNISESTFVFGSATRFSIDKGIDIILRALPVEGDWKYLMMGSGSETEKERLRAIIRERNIGDKVIETGMIGWYDIAKYWNAIDCAIHVPLTTSHWEETFSLSAIQPQITKKPIIGDTSGSVPYQIGFDNLLVPEGDIAALHDKILWILSHKEKAIQIGKQLYLRTLNSFEIQHLNDMFYDTLVEDILPGKYDLGKIDMTTYKTKR